MHNNDHVGGVQERDNSEPLFYPHHDNSELIPVDGNDPRPKKA